MVDTLTNEAVALPTSGPQAGGTLGSTAGAVLDDALIPYHREYSIQEGKSDFTGSVTPLAGPSSVSVSASTDTSVTFSQRVREVIVGNSLTVDIYIMFDAAASAGTLRVPARTTLSFAAYCTVLHVYSPDATTVNGASEGIFVMGGL